MPQIGWLEIISVVIIAILVLGPKEFPLALKKIGSYIGKIKNTLSNLKREVSSVTNEIDIDDITHTASVTLANGGNVATNDLVIFADQQLDTSSIKQQL